MRKTAAKKRPKRYGSPRSTHNYKSARRLLAESGRGMKPFHASTRIGRALRSFARDLREQLGGDVTRAQEALIEQATRVQFLLWVVDSYIAESGSVVNKRKRTLFPIVRERQSLADSLTRTLTALGLERRARPTEGLQAYLARVAAQGEAAAEAAENG